MNSPRITINVYVLRLTQTFDSHVLSLQRVQSLARPHLGFPNLRWRSSAALTILRMPHKGDTNRVQLLEKLEVPNQNVRAFHFKKTLCPISLLDTSNSKSLFYHHLKSSILSPNPHIYLHFTTQCDNSPKQAIFSSSTIDFSPYGIDLRFIIHHSTFTIHRSSFIIHSSPFIGCPVVLCVGKCLGHTLLTRTT